MSHKHRIKALECFLTQRRQAAAVDPARLRQFFYNLHRAYGEPGTPPPVLTAAELLEMDAQLWAAIDKPKG